ncbi:phospholipase D-like domain-containing protein [Flavobacterium sp.]|jgi:phosphatidylserine/phosphatidylglycerophosphate/cardiolipin synthase-like enzyme|uniref:phospholipase D-like domain-containing protein n=1 Tax=Flavobacterium sp. TaxID=239 RepID=UPI0037BF5D93
MIRYFPLSILIFFLLTIFPVFGQESIPEKDFTVHYYSTRLELEFDKSKAPSSIKVTDALSNNEVPIEKTPNSNLWVINSIKPSQFFTIEYTVNTDKTSVLSSTTIASKSASSGTITVYFNHSVDTTFSQTQNAVNLSNTLDDMLITYINNCVATLDIAIYNSYSPSTTTGIASAINAAFARGVQVRVIYDGSTSSVMIPLLNSAIPKLASPTSSSYAIMHNKFVVFDANNSNPNLPYVWSGSTNWTTAQIDGPDRNNVIVLQDQTLALAYTIEFEEMWGGSSATPNATTSKFGPYKANNTPHNFVIGGKTVESYFSPSDGTTSKIITALNSANSDIEIAVMNFTRSDISAALISSYSNGFTNINVLLDSSNPSGNQIGTLQTGLLPNHALVDTAPGIMHHKFMVVDNFDSTSDPLVLVGSHNWSTSAETKNDENTLIVHDANVTNQYFQAFASMYQIAGGTLSNLENTTDEKSILKIVPNPNNGIFDIVSNNTIEHLDLVVYDVLGKRIASKIYNSFYACSMDLSAESAGFYYIEATADGTIFHYKFIKK